MNGVSFEYFIAYLIGIAANITTKGIDFAVQFTKEQLIARVAKDEEARLKKQIHSLSGIKSPSNLRALLSQVANRTDSLKRNTKASSAHCALIDLLKDQVFREALADWLIGDNPDRVGKAKVVIAKNIERTLLQYGIQENEMEAFVHYFDIVDAVVFKNTRLTYWRLQMAGMKDANKTLSRIERRLISEGQTSQYRRFEQDYLQYLSNLYGRIRMLGVPEMKDIRQPLNIAYISLRARMADSDRDSALMEVRSAERMLSDNANVTIRGPAGSGKTTLLHWIILQCARTENNEDSWGGLVPFYVPLRVLSPQEHGRPDLSHLADYGIGTKLFPSKVPDGWISEVVKSQKRGVLLLDGVDELPSTYRPSLWEWLREFIHSYPGNRVVVTSRFFPEPRHSSDSERLWDPPPHFFAAVLEEMNDKDIAEFVMKWHDAVISNATDPTERDEARKRREELPEKLQFPVNSKVRDLCRSPLLCALVCALHWHEEGYLPTRRIELYEKCCSMLVDERDLKRELKPPLGPLSYLSPDDKMMILQKLALDMMRNDLDSNKGEYAIQITRARASQWISSYIRLIESEKARRCYPEQILNHLIERTSLLREPSKGYVDFPHRTFQEYLAACAAGAWNCSGELTKHASDDQWRETIVLAAGTRYGGIPFGKQLIRDLLDYGIRSNIDKKTKTACLSLAVACLETAKQLESDERENVLHHLNEIIPPRNFEEAKSLAAAGERVLAFIKYQSIKEKPSMVAASCARTLAIIGSSATLKELREHYASDRREEVLTEVCRIPGINPIELPFVVEHAKTYGYLPGFARHYARNLVPLSNIPSIISLDLSDFASVVDLSSLSGLRHIEQLNIADRSDLYNLDNIRNMASLKLLSIKRCKGLTTIEALSHLQALESLELVSCPSVNNVAPIARLPNLIYLSLENCACLSDFKYLNMLICLEVLDLSGCIGLDDLVFACSLSSLRKLSLKGCTLISDLSPLSALPDLRMLDLKGCHGVSDFSPLARMRSLVQLRIDMAVLKQIPSSLERAVVL